MNKGIILLCFKLLFVLFVISVPSIGFSQMIYGDPSLTHDIGHGKIELGGSIAKDQALKIKATEAPGSALNTNFTWKVPGAKKDIGSENFFLTAEMGIGRIVDVFVNIGQSRINKPIDGNFNFAGGGGLRISPPQSGVIKIGVVVQTYSFSSESDDVAFDVFETGTASDNSKIFFVAQGKGKEKIRLDRYDAVLGFGVDKISYIRPYAGLLFTMINGTDERSFSGQGSACVIPSGGSCTASSSTNISFSYKQDIASDSSIGGIAGIVFNPKEDMGMTIESQFGPQATIAASAFVKF